MRKLSFILILLFPIAAFADSPSLPAQKSQIEAANISTKVIKHYLPDQARLLYSIKADIKNNGPAVKFIVDIQGIDAEGYEITTIALQGILEEGETKTFTDSASIEAALFEKIKKWTVKHAIP